MKREILNQIKKLQDKKAKTQQKLASLGTKKEMLDKGYEVGRFVSRKSQDSRLTEQINGLNKKIKYYDIKIGLLIKEVCKK
jgi:flagellar biosynthesis chaperone FliJ